MIRTAVITLVVVAMATLGCAQETGGADEAASASVTSSDPVATPSGDEALAPSRARAPSDGMKECDECSNSRRTCCAEGRCWVESC